MAMVVKISQIKYSQRIKKKNEKSTNLLSGSLETKERKTETNGRKHLTPEHEINSIYFNSYDNECICGKFDTTRRVLGQKKDLQFTDAKISFLKS